jgi:hypothetical protein
MTPLVVGKAKMVRLTLKIMLMIKFSKFKKIGLFIFFILKHWVVSFRIKSKKKLNLKI